MTHCLVLDIGSFTPERAFEVTLYILLLGASTFPIRVLSCKVMTRLNNREIQRHQPYCPFSFVPFPFPPVMILQQQVRMIVAHGIKATNSGSKDVCFQPLLVVKNNPPRRTPHEQKFNHAMDVNADEVRVFHHGFRGKGLCAERRRQARVYNRRWAIRCEAWEVSRAADRRRVLYDSSLRRPPRC